MKSFTLSSLAVGSLLLSGALNAAPPTETVDASLEGELMIVHIDYKDRKSEFAYHVKDQQTGEIIELKFERKPPHDLHTGDQISVRGKMQGKQIWVQDVSGTQSSEDASTAAGDQVAGAAVERRAIYILVNFGNSSNPAYYPATEATTAANRLFYDTYSVDHVYQEGSFGNVAFPPAAGKVVGPLSINAPATCDYYSIASMADTAATNAGENLSLYNRKIYLIPPSPVGPCNWLALGQVGSYGSTGTRLSWSTSDNANALIHELGHNEGWHHAGTDTDNNEILDAGTSGEYGDTSDAMGYCCSQRKFNAVHLHQIGWLPSAKATTAVTSGIYYLEPVGNYANSTCVAPDGISACPQLLKIQKDFGTYQYNLSYRQIKGLDSGMNTVYTTGVNIHNGLQNDIWSYHVKTLTDGATFTDSVNGISITQLSHDANMVAVRVSLTPLPVPADPSGLVATTTSTSAINLSWIDNSSDETGFKIERSDNGSSGWSEVGQVGAGATNYQNSGLSAGTTYFYRVFAFNSGGNSNNSTNVANATTEIALPPAAPSNFTATAVSGRKINLQWSDNADNETSYVVQLSTDNGNSWKNLATLGANSTSYSKSGLKVGTTYFFRLYASNASGNSNAVTASAKAIR